jgi:hypothetical protein
VHVGGRGHIFVLIWDVHACTPAIVSHPHSTETKPNNATALPPFWLSGGAQALLAVRGQDCTQVFLDNHPYTNPSELLAPYEVR